MTEEEMQSVPLFKPWPKIARLKSGLTCTITYKVDGTNGCLIVQDDKLVGVQSRKRLIDRHNDNMGFANWAYDNEEELVKLGHGYHYGEWAGPGIQKNPHKLEQKTFYLFNTSRPQETLPDCVKMVPVLYQGPYSPEVVDQVMREEIDEENGDEGIIVYFHEFRTSLKKTVRDPEGKWVK